jgi:hypothetical protein
MYFVKAATHATTQFLLLIRPAEKLSQIDINVLNACQGLPGAK